MPGKTGTDLEYLQDAVESLEDGEEAFTVIVENGKYILKDASGATYQ